MTLTVFFKGDVIARGTQEEVAPAMRALQPLERASDLLAFEDESGRQVDFDLRAAPPVTPRRGRPSLGVEAREVTLLPRHWEWLGIQSGGASVALRKLVEEARRSSADKDRIRKAHERAYHFMSAMAGDLPGFEEGIRALFANDQAKFKQLISNWPEDIRDHARRLAFGEVSTVPVK